MDVTTLRSMLDFKIFKKNVVREWRIRYPPSRRVRQGWEQGRKGQGRVEDQKPSAFPASALVSQSSLRFAAGKGASGLSRPPRCLTWVRGLGFSGRAFCPPATSCVTEALLVQGLQRSTRIGQGAAYVGNIALRSLCGLKGLGSLGGHAPSTQTSNPELPNLSSTLPRWLPRWLCRTRRSCFAGPCSVLGSWGLSRFT